MHGTFKVGENREFTSSSQRSFTQKFSYLIEGLMINEKKYLRNFLPFVSGVFVLKTETAKKINTRNVFKVLIVRD